MSAKVRLRRTAHRATASLQATAWIVEGADDLAVLEIGGAIGNSTVAEFQEFVNRVLQNASIRRMVLDLSRLTEIGSKGLAELSMLRDRLGEIVLAGVDGKVRIVMKMLGLLDAFREFPKKQAALAALLS